MVEYIEEIPIDALAAWIVGITLSSVSLLAQVLVYMVVDCSRKPAMMLLTMISVARLFNSCLEYVTRLGLDNEYLINAIFALYTQTDAVIVCTMFVFTNILYKKVTKVFVQHLRFVHSMLTIWIATFPIGVLGPVFLNMDFDNQKRNQTVSYNYFSIYYYTYTAVKYIVLAINFIYICKVLQIVFERRDLLKCNHKVRKYMIYFILVNITSLHVLVNDLFSCFSDSDIVSITYEAMNSYQVILYTAMFVVIVKRACDRKGKTLLLVIVNKILCKKVINPTEINVKAIGSNHSGQTVPTV